VTIDAAVTASIYTGDHQSALVLAHLLSLPRPPNAGRHDTHAWPLDPFTGGQAKITCARRSDRPKSSIPLRAIETKEPRVAGVSQLR
jgi:hypothetical protein